MNFPPSQFSLNTVAYKNKQYIGRGKYEQQKGSKKISKKVAEGFGIAARIAKENNNDRHV